MFMQIDFIRKSCGGRPRIARKEWKFCASPFFLRSKICVFLFLLFIVFPSEYFSLFCCFFTFVQNYFLFSLNINERSWFGVWFVVRLKQDWKMWIMSFVQHTCFLSSSGVRSRESFSPRELSLEILRSHQHIHSRSPHFYGSPQKRGYLAIRERRENYVISTWYCEYFPCSLWCRKKKRN